jgi:hypothetical protein
VPLPPHLDLAEHERVAEQRTLTEQDLKNEPGYWVQFVPRVGGGTDIVSRMQLGPDGQEPPKMNKHRGLYARGQPKRVTQLVPMDQIESLKEIAKLEKQGQAAAATAAAAAAAAKTAKK